MCVCVCVCVSVCVYLWSECKYKLAMKVCRLGASYRQP